MHGSENTAHVFQLYASFPDRENNAHVLLCTQPTHGSENTAHVLQVYASFPDRENTAHVLQLYATYHGKENTAPCTPGVRNLPW